MKTVSSILQVFIALFFSCAALAAPGWIIATPGETVQGGEMLQLETVRPDENTSWPAFLRLKLVTDQKTEIIIFRPDDAAPASGSRRTYTATLPHLRGQLKIELADVVSNRLMLLATGPAEQPVEAFPETVGKIDPISEGETALSAHEPVYFLLGMRKGMNARYQISFKYRIFDEESTPAQWLPALKQLHFGYTQTATWDLGVDSKPFHDTSYRPSLFWQKRLDDSGEPMSRYLRAGFEHESNGKDGINSRSINQAYLQPAWRADFADGNSLIFAPRFYSYLDKTDNPDIARYRGHADWLLRYGDESEWVLSSRVRIGTAGHSTQVDLSVPLRKPLFARTGGFVYLQLFSGYGETLLDYNQRHPAQLRVGFSIVR